jgi:type IV secretory pathway VirJ component
LRAQKILPWLLIAALAAALSYGAYLHRPRPLITDQFGPVIAFPPWLRERGVVYVLSGAEGWTRADQWTAWSYAARDNYVVGIDTPRVLDYLNQHAKGCVFFPGLFEDFSRVQERTVGTAHDFEPIVLGRGVGATLAYLGQVGAPVLAIGAAVILDPEPRFHFTPPVCENRATPVGAGLQQLRADALGPNVPARIWLDTEASAESRAFVASLPAGPAPASAPAAPTIAPRSFTLRGTYAAALKDIESERQRSGVSDLPLVEVPARERRSKVIAVLYSGDGGWRDLDRSLASVLAGKGMSVVGVDVLRYYWRTRQPDSAARDLARIVHSYKRRWGGEKVVLIGFSFGANVIPFIVNRLPADVRSDIRLITLLSPERTTAFEVSPAGWVGKASDATIPIEPELKSLSTIRLQCVYGEDEAQDSLCTLPAAAGFELVRKPGGHHFDHNYDELADSILAESGG